MHTRLTAEQHKNHGIPPRLTDVEALTSYTHYLLMKAQLAGNTTPAIRPPSDETLAIAAQCRALSDELQRRLNKCSEADAAILLECYGMTYLIGYGHTPDNDYIIRQQQRIFTAWQSGNKRIDDSAVFGILASEMLQRGPGAPPEHITTYLAIKDQWIATLLEHNRFADTTVCENYRRLTLIMRENLDGYCKNQRAIKRRWYEHNRTDNLTALDTHALQSYRNLACALTPAVLSAKAWQTLDRRILSELTGRPDLNPYAREAFRLALHQS